MDTFFSCLTVLWFVAVAVAMLASGMLIFSLSRHEDDWVVRFIFAFCGIAVFALGLATLSIAFGGGLW